MTRSWGSMASALRALWSNWQPRQFEIVIFGSGHMEWAPSILPHSPVWEGMARVASVRAVNDDWQPRNGELGQSTLVIPFLERNLRRAPEGCWGLIPSRAGLDTFADKGRFAVFARDQQLEALVPTTYWTPQEAAFPLVLKRTNLAAGQGMAVIRGPEELAQALGAPPFAGQATVMQEHIASLRDYVTHCICREGRILQSCTFEYTQLDPMVIPTPAPEDRTRQVEVTGSDLRNFERFLRPVAYTGPCNFNFRRRPDGRMGVFEINPRFGGSLFRAPHRAHLRRQLKCLIDNALWREPKP